MSRASTALAVRSSDAQQHRRSIHRGIWVVVLAGIVSIHAPPAITGFSASGASAPRLRVPPRASLPQITGPVPQTAESRAFDSALRARTPLDLAAHGYIEEEYFLSGTAHVYDWPAPGRLEALGAGPYVTRILLRRPRDPRRFNGAVIVEPFNPSQGLDLDLMWVFSHDYFMREGYAWVGVTVKPVAIAALKRFDARRYERLSLANPLAPAARCPDPELGPHDTSSEVGLAPDIESQLGVWVRSRSDRNPLHGYRVTRVYLTGYSQTAGYVRDYASAISPHVRGPDGAVIYDGYLAAGQAPFNVPLNDCAALFRPDDPRLRVEAIGVPFIDVASESDTLVDAFMRRPDGDRAPDLFRRYEVAGATHIDDWIGRFSPTAADIERAGAREVSARDCIPAEPGLSEFPLRYVLDVLWQNLDAWVTRAVAPPPGAELTLLRDAASVRTLKDEHGNAVGGVRTPTVDVPTETWHSSRGGPDHCMRMGYEVPFAAATLRRLYPSHAAYVRAVTTDVRRLLAARWLTPLDATSIIAQAQRSSVP